MESFKKFLLNPRIIFAIFGLILLVELISAVKILTQPTPPPPTRKAGIQEADQRLYLSTTRTTYKVNEVISISVVLESRSRKISGADLVLNFDPKIIEATPGVIEKGTFFDEYPVLSVDKTKGIITLSGVSNTKGGIQTQGQFAKLLLRAKAPGKTSLTIAFTKGSTADSNLAAANTAEDILESVGNLELIIQ